MLKSAFEVDRLRRSAAIQAHVIRRATEVLRPGLAEIEVVAELEAEARRHGHQGFVRKHSN